MFKNIKDFPILDIKSPACPISLNWRDNPDIQKLLDVISEIIANEYIEVAKRNSDVFMDPRFRGDNRGEDDSGGGK